MLGALWNLPAVAECNSAEQQIGNLRYQCALLALFVPALLALSAISSPAQPITNPFGPSRIVIMPGASLQLQGDNIGNLPITPAPSVMNFPLEDNAAPFAFSEFNPAVVRVGERATYRLMINCPAGEVQPPETIVTSTGLQLTHGGHSQEMVFMNNRVRRILVYNYHCTPDKPGMVAVPGFRFPANGTIAFTFDAFLEVGSGDDTPVPRLPELVLEVPDRTVYVGETIPVHIIVSNPGDGLLLNVSALEVSGDGVIVDRDSIFTRQRKTVTNLSGKMVVTIETEALTTVLRAGPLKLNAQAEVTVDPPQPMPPPLQGYRPLIEAMPLTIHPVPLPAGGTLPGFNGAIGRFQMQPALSTNSMFVGEPVALSVTVQGEGNLRTIAAPEPAKDDAWKVLPPEMDPPQMNGGVIVRTFRYALIPTTDKVKATPPVPFSYFDPATAKYVDLTFPPLPVTVVPLPTNEAAAYAAGQPGRPVGAPAATVEEPEDTLRPLADSRGKIAGTLVPLQARPWFLRVQLVPAGLLAGLWLWDRRRRFLAAHPEVLALRAARRACRRHEAVAQAAARTGDRLAFTTAIVGAIREVCAPRIGAHPDSLVCSDILQLLPPYRVEQNRELVSTLFAELNARRFGDERVEAGTLPRDFAAAVDLLAGLDGELRAYVSHRVRQRVNGRSFTRPDHSIATGPGASNGARSAPMIGLLVICLTALSAAPAGSADSSSARLTPDKFQRGVAAYVAGKHDQAADAFRESADQQPSSGAFHNLGNAEWLRGRAGEAILAWERAVWLDPFDQNSRLNLRFARKAGHLDAPALTWLEVCSSWLPAGFWAGTAMASFWFAAALLVLPHVFRWRKSYWHQLGVAVGLTVFLLTLPALFGVQSRGHRGVVVVDETPVRLTPTVHGEILARLPAGETATFGRKRGACFYVQTASGTSGWVNTNGFRLIAKE